MVWRERGSGTSTSRCWTGISTSLTPTPSPPWSDSPGPRSGCSWSKPRLPVQHNLSTLRKVQPILKAQAKGRQPVTAAAFLQNTFGASLTTADVEKRIGEDLAIEGLTPRLHFPMLAGMRQGPGFANLSCLGRLSDRILSSYVEGAT